MSGRVVPWDVVGDLVGVTGTVVDSGMGYATPMTPWPPGESETFKPYIPPQRLAPGLCRIKIGEQEVIVQLDGRDTEAMIAAIVEKSTALAVARKLEGAEAQPMAEMSAGPVVKSFMPMRPNPLIKTFADPGVITMDTF